MSVYEEAVTAEERRNIRADRVMMAGLLAFREDMTLSGGLNAFADYRRDRHQQHVALPYCLPHTRSPSLTSSTLAGRSRAVNQNIGHLFR
jgi:hypothetical protein